MPITAAQKAVADQQQWAAARDRAPQVRLVAGPGTGKSHTIEKRVADLLLNGVTPTNVYVISFTHLLTGCFRCTPAMLGPATRLIVFNPSRVAKGPSEDNYVTGGVALGVMVSFHSP